MISWSHPLYVWGVSGPWWSPADSLAAAEPPAGCLEMEHPGSQSEREVIMLKKGGNKNAERGVINYWKGRF